MDYITGFVKILSVSSVVLAALRLIVPKGNSDAIFKYAMGIFIISVILSSVNIYLKNPPEMPTLSESFEVTERGEGLTNSTTEYIIEQLLNKCNVKYKEVRIITDNSADTGINIIGVKVDFVDEKDFEFAAEIIKNQTGITLIR